MSHDDDKKLPPGDTGKPPEKLNLQETLLAMGRRETPPILVPRMFSDEMLRQHGRVLSIARWALRVHSEEIRREFGKDGPLSEEELLRLEVEVGQELLELQGTLKQITAMKEDFETRVAQMESDALGKEHFS